MARSRKKTPTRDDCGSDVEASNYRKVARRRDRRRMRTRNRGRTSNVDKCLTADMESGIGFETKPLRNSGCTICQQIGIRTYRYLEVEDPAWGQEEIVEDDDRDSPSSPPQKTTPEMLNFPIPHDRQKQHEKEWKIFETCHRLTCLTAYRKLVCK
eukprot:TRINITY_DN11167_c0_g1_i1.p1 TRINITY_DN11167_c0_g1~~TRINITY_DN11167_c0_g1_i1.p1  ORF type:complete len:155 (-),score=19.32 TRINITY_DN11167_c0_g1_i1:39-503(-)